MSMGKRLGAGAQHSEAPACLRRRACLKWPSLLSALLPHSGLRARVLRGLAGGLLKWVSLPFSSRIASFCNCLFVYHYLLLFYCFILPSVLGLSIIRDYQCLLKY